MNQTAVAFLLLLSAAIVPAASRRLEHDDSGGGWGYAPECAGTIVELAVGTPDLSTLVAAVTAADLAETLSGDGLFTVFAPTNDAFAALPNGTLDSLLLPENIDTLTDILLYHVVPGSVLSTDLSNGPVETLNGDAVEVHVSSKKGVMINDANVIIADIIACNGVVHVIDAVLLPPEEPEPEPEPEPYGKSGKGSKGGYGYGSKGGYGYGSKGGYGYYGKSGKGSKGGYYYEPEPVPEPKKPGHWEFVYYPAPPEPYWPYPDPEPMPEPEPEPHGYYYGKSGKGSKGYGYDDDGYYGYGKGGKGGYYEPEPEPEPHYAEPEPHYPEPEPYWGEPEHPKPAPHPEPEPEPEPEPYGKSGKGGGYGYGYGSKGSKGGYYEPVPEPEPMPEPEPHYPEPPAPKPKPSECAGTIVELAVGTPDLSTLVAAVTAADLVETLSGDGPFTVFAPTNDAFAALPKGTLDSLLLPENIKSLTDILLYHVVSGTVLSTDLSNGPVETVNGATVEVKVSSKKGVMINDANVVIADIIACNGVVHVIDAVLLPPEGKKSHYSEEMHFSQSVKEESTSDAHISHRLVGAIFSVVTGGAALFLF